jgi:hypothetical protein
MTDPISFDSTTPRFGMPLLFAGQSQKEVFVNEALALSDALLHCIVEAEQAVPPAVPTDGLAWLVGATPTGEWAGQGGKIACRQLGQWLFVTPRDGMRLVNKATGQDWRRIAGAWKAPVAPAAPTGGTTIDAEVRAALANLVQRLRDAGVFASA